MKTVAFFIALLFPLMIFPAESMASSDQHASKLTVSKRGVQVATFKGAGSQTTKSFTLKQGPATFDVVLSWERLDSTLKGKEGKFSVVLLDEKGKYVDLIIGTIDHFDGSRTVDIPATGQYMLKITAPGEWSVEIEQ